MFSTVHFYEFHRLKCAGTFDTIERFSPINPIRIVVLANPLSETVRLFLFNSPYILHARRRFDGGTAGGPAMCYAEHRSSSPGADNQKSKKRFLGESKGLYRRQFQEGLGLYRSFYRCKEEVERAPTLFSFSGSTRRWDLVCDPTISDRILSIHQISPANAEKISFLTIDQIKFRTSFQL